MSLVSFSLNSLDSASSSASKQDRFVISRSDFKEFADCYKSNSKKSVLELEDQPNDENKIYSSVLKNNLNVTKSLKKPSKTTHEFGEEDFSETKKIEIPAKLAEVNRKIQKAPFKVLDAPDLQDDFYLNVVDWSMSDVLAVGLGTSVFTWSFQNNMVEKVMNFPDNVLVSGVCWDTHSNMLALGSISGVVKLWDVNKRSNVLDIKDHQERVGALSLQGNLLLTGSRDKSVLMHDLREGKRVMSFPGHKQEVCGLRWSPDGTYFASGGNDNKLFVFSPKMSLPLMKKNHKAAVKAIAWNERNPGILATGAGTADRCIRLWNINEKKLIDFKDTGSQICNIAFSKLDDELITTHGYSNNEICVWKVKNLKKIASLTGHASRVLYLAVDPRGENIVTGAGDETLRFWNLGHNSVTSPKKTSPFEMMKGLR